MAKYPEYKTKYKSLGLKDKVLAKYYSTGGAKVNNLVKEAAINAAPGIGVVGKIVPKATRVVKELATKFKNKSLTDADKAFYSGANKTPEDKAINKMLQGYTKKHRANK